MKTLRKGSGAKQWSQEVRYTGSGNGSGGCAAFLLVEERDLFMTKSSHYDGSTDYYTTFMCPECGCLTDLYNYAKPGLPTFQEWKDKGGYDQVTLLATRIVDALVNKFKSMKDAKPGDMHQEMVQSTAKIIKRFSNAT